MTVTVQQLTDTAQTILPDARVRITGASGEDYPIQTLLADGDVLVIRIQDEVSDADDEDDCEDEDDE